MSDHCDQRHVSLCAKPMEVSVLGNLQCVFSYTVPCPHQKTYEVRR
jgi:hypothetical protein